MQGCAGIQVHLLHKILRGQESIMASFQELQDEIQRLEQKVGNLAAAIDADQGSDAQVIAGLEAQKAVLQAEINVKQAEIDRLTAEGQAVPAQIQASMDRLTGVQDNLDKAISDVSGPNVVVPEPEPEPEPEPPVEEGPTGASGVSESEFDEP